MELAEFGGLMWSENGVSKGFIEGYNILKMKVIWSSTRV